jgi:iron complex outermembrane recepter protein
MMREVRSFRSAMLLARCGGLVLVAACLSAPAHAQEPDEPEQGQQDKATVQEKEGAVKAVEEVVVTARRREERLQDTPVAISPFNAETLEARQIQQTQDLERIAPSLQFKPAGQLSGNTAATVV